jgi:hypothetical protein
MTKKNTKREPDSPPLDLTTKHGVSHWTRIVGHYMLTLANDVPRLDALELMSSRQRRDLAKDLITNTVHILRIHHWDEALRWLRDNAPRGLVCGLEDKYRMVPIHDFHDVASLTSQLGPGETYATPSLQKKWPDTVLELVHLGEMLRAFGQSLVEACAATVNGARAEGNGKAKPGRKHLSRSEDKKRQGILARWAEAKGRRSREEFCSDEGITVGYLEACQGCVNQRKRRSAEQNRGHSTL